MNFDNKNFILHIGLHKTGSTFIQKHLNLIKNDNFKLFILDDLCEYLVDYLEDSNQIKKKKIYNIIDKIDDWEPPFVFTASPNPRVKFG